MWYDEYAIFLNSNVDVQWWALLLIALFFFSANFVLFCVMWYVRREVAIEVGYPRKSKKSLRKYIKTFSFLDKVTLRRLTREAKQKNIMLYLNYFDNWLNILAILVSAAGFVAAFVTNGTGWAMTLLVVPVLAVMGITVMIEFVPHLIWVPSERKRYSLKKHR